MILLPTAKCIGGIISKRVGDSHGDEEQRLTVLIPTAIPDAMLPTDPKVPRERRRSNTKSQWMHAGMSSLPFFQPEQKNTTEDPLSAPFQ